jgi:hypothetical protein
MCWNDPTTYQEPLMSSLALTTLIEYYLDHGPATGRHHGGGWERVTD